MRLWIGGTALMLSTVACAGADDPSEPLTASQTQLLFTAPSPDAPDSASELFVLWDVSSSSPDYAYAWGSGDVSDGVLSLSLDSRPPVEALNSYGLGVGFLIAVRSGNVPASGKFDFDALRDEVTGVTARHAIIYIDRALQDAALREWEDNGELDKLERARGHWMFDFPEGYACGEGRDAPPGEVFDSFVPVDCDQMRIVFDDLANVEIVNWT